MMTFQKSLKKLSLRLARPDILFWVMPFLMVLLVVGTVAQKDLGIFTSQQRYFSSYFFMLGFVPLPGGLTLMSIFSINLLAKFLFKSDWSWKKSGTIVTHFGVLVLVFGGAISFFTSREGYLVVPQGETRNQIEDYHQREMVIRDGDTILLSIPHDQLKDGLTVQDPSTPFAITITTYCFNCGITRRAIVDQEGWTSPGKFMQLNVKAPDPQDERNMTGIEFTVSGAGPEIDGKYLTFDKFPKPPQITIKGKTYTIAIERAKRPLPFSITLQKFEQNFHPGTDMASAYKSTVTVTDGANTWPAFIEMNEPLRYRGYTLYQSSFDVSGEKPYTVLTVVENKGRIFPYLATLIIACGLILHLAIRLTQARGGRHA
jgi:hypothetical protein